MTDLSSLRGAFRERYLDYAEITAQLRRWAEAFPGLVRLESAGRSSEGRELWVLVLGRDPDRARPAVWIDGNMHAVEVCGSSVALALAEDILGTLVDPSRELHGLPPHVRASLSETLFYVMPRMSPDGAEQVLKSGRFVRSTTTDDRPHRQGARWLSQDLDGDGVAMLMRKEDATGEYVELPGGRGLMAPRTLEDAGPYYKLYPEGVIENFNGSVVPEPAYLSEFPLDLNRNFPWTWRPEPDQEGAGEFPGSAPESRAVMEYVTKRPHLFAWLNLHTFGGVFIRPLGTGPDTRMHEHDLALFRQIGEWNEKLTGYPTVNGFDEFTYTPDKPLYGDIADFAYHQRGCIAYVCELWDLFKQIGMARPKRFVDHYTHMTRENLARFAAWDAEHNKSRVIRPWKRFAHPQLGQVEVGGLDPRVGVNNPPYERVSEICAAQSAAFLRVAALAPRVRIARAEKTRVGEGLTHVHLTVENQGYLPTFVLSSSRELTWNEPLYAEVRSSGCELVDKSRQRVEIGHLDGWGRGLFDGTGLLNFMRSRGSSGRSELGWTVRGSGKLTLRVGSCRVGWVEQTLEL